MARLKKVDFEALEISSGLHFMKNPNFFFEIIKEKLSQSSKQNNNLVTSKKAFECPSFHHPAFLFMFL